MVGLTVVSLVLCLGACSSPEQKASAPVSEKSAPVQQEMPEDVSNTASSEEPEAPKEPVIMEDMENSVISLGNISAEETQDIPSDSEDSAEQKQVRQPDPNKKIIEGAPEQPEVRDPADFMPEKRPYAESPYADQIDKGLAWLAANENQRSCNWMDYFVLDYLQRKFGLDESFAAEKVINLDNADPDSATLMALYARLVREGYKIGDVEIPIEDASLFADYQPGEDQTLVTPDMLEHLGTSMSGAMLRAMYCDQAAVDEAFVNEVVRQIRETEFKGKPNTMGGYIISHMALACKWLKENGCAESFDILAGIEEELANLLVAIADDQQVVTDLGMEAVALLHYLGHSDKVKQEWVTAIAAAQMAEGCWDRQGGKIAPPVPQGHATAFALWVLLEDALPDAPEIPWLR